MDEYLNNYKKVDEISRKEIPFVEALYELTEKELEFQANRASLYNIKVTHFPFNRSQEEFDFQPSINKKEIMDLGTLRFIEEKKNVVFVGSSGVGKTHLSVAIGTEAAKKRISTYFISCHDLIAKLSLAHKENRFTNVLKQFCKYKLLIIDEVGYLPVDKNGANLF